MQAQQINRAVYKDGKWHVSLSPSVSGLFKRLFDGVEKVGQELTLSDSPANAKNLLWFSERHPVLFQPSMRVVAQAAIQDEREDSIRRILSSEYVPSNAGLALPLRDYQGRAVDLVLANGALLVGDDVGLGKTGVGIGVLARPIALPAVVVTLTALPLQWQREIKRFAPELRTHIIKTSKPYPLDYAKGRRVLPPDVIIMSYSKLTTRTGGKSWAEVIADENLCRTLIFDEGQELRNDESARYKAAKYLRDSATYCALLTATPVYNHGGEIYNVVSIVQPGALGDKKEFLREWCGREQSGDGESGAEMRKVRVKDPKALGTHLRDIGVFLRRTREEVGRELPPLQRVFHPIETNGLEIPDNVDIERLCRIVLAQGGNPQDKMRAGGELDWRLRQATGLAKAPEVASLVRLLIESGEKVVLYGWHRSCFAPGTPVLMYDGTTKPVERVCVGDVVMGPDSTPRTVKSLMSGEAPMYRVIPTKGDPWVCSDHHLLSLRCKAKNRTPITTISARDFAERTPRAQQDLTLYRAPAVTFQGGNVPEPWLMGFWLGDGSSDLSRGVVLTSTDPEVATEAELIAARHGVRVRQHKVRGGIGGKTCFFLAFSKSKHGSSANQLTRIFKSYGVHKNKHIPLAYKVAPLADRRELLAGLLDSDGHVFQTKNSAGSATYSSISRILAEDVAFVCRSLGLAAYVHLKQRVSRFGGDGKIYVVTISGDLTQLPMRIERKHAPVRKNRKDVLNVGLRLEDAGPGEYFGFEVDGDHLFLLGDFTVVHNCYDMWRELFSNKEQGDLKPAWYTGSESVGQKDEARRRFVEDETDLIILSLRSGAGLDGLQFKCRVAVVGELDWSPGVLEQDEGRIFRDGQKHPVTIYYPVTDEGADPVMLDTLNLKTEQSEGIRNLTSEAVKIKGTDPQHIRKLAESHLRRIGKL